MTSHPRAIRGRKLQVHRRHGRIWPGPEPVARQDAVGATFVSQSEQAGRVQPARRGVGRARRDGGAALVELAIITPVLFLILFGIMEFGWAFGQHLDVRHGAREGARLAAVNYRPDTDTSGTAQTAAIISQVCDRLGLPSVAGVELSFVDSGPNNNLQGDRAEIEVGTNFDTLTGFLDPILAGVRLESTVQFRLERDASWSAGSGTCS